MNALTENGLIIKNGRLCGDKRSPQKTLRFIAELRKRADDAEKKSLAVTEYKARVLKQNARAARREADRIESDLD